MDKPTRKVRAGQPCGEDHGCLPVEYTEQQLAVWKADEEKRRKQLERVADIECFITIGIVIALAVVTVLWFWGVMSIAP